MVIKSFVAMILSLVVFLAIFDYSISSEEGEVAVVLFEMTSNTFIKTENYEKKFSVGTQAKLMTILLSAEAIEKGELSLEDTIKVSSYPNTIKGPTIWLMPNEEISVEDILKGIIIGNANDACAAIAEEICGSEEKFVDLMNTRADELGMRDTSFTNSNGYFDEENQISTAKDLAILAGEICKYDFLEKYFTTTLDYIRGEETQLVNTNKLISNFSGAFGFKFGNSKENGCSLVGGAKKSGDETFIVVILGYDDKDSLFYDAKAILKNAFESYFVIVPEIPKELPEKIKLRDSFEKEFEIYSIVEKNILLKKGDGDSISCKIFLPDFVYAPIEIREKVGEIHFYRNEKFLFSVDILSKEMVEKRDFIKSIGILFKNMLSF